MEPLQLIVECVRTRPADATRARHGGAGWDTANPLSHDRRQRRLEGWELPTNAVTNSVAVLVPILIATMVLCRTILVEVALPVAGSAGNASGQVVLPPLSVEIHDGGVDVYEEDRLVETVPWPDGDELNDLSTGWQGATVSPVEHQGPTVLPDGATDEEPLTPLVNGYRVVEG